MFGGVSSLEPQNYMEQVTLTFMMLLGSLVWAWVIGSVCSLLAAFNPYETECTVAGTRTQVGPDTCRFIQKVTEGSLTVQTMCHEAVISPPADALHGLPWR